MPGDFDPAYLTTLDEIYHSHWAMEKRRRIDQLKAAVDSFWPDGHPSKLIHVSGTNGKGSVCCALDQALRFAGPTGSWTGPHVFDYAERIRINTQNACREEIVEIYRGRLLPYQTQLAATTGGETLTFAQLGILLALCLFDRHGIEWAAMESGVGGRYTPLMALDVKASVVTDVGTDHLKTLGTELWQRALEKAGVARAGIPFFTAARGDALRFVVETACSEGAEVQAVDQDDLRAVAALLPPGTPDHLIRNRALAARIVRHFYPRAPTGYRARRLARASCRLGSLSLRTEWWRMWLTMPTRPPLWPSGSALSSPPSASASSWDCRGSGTRCRCCVPCSARQARSR